MTPQAPGYFRFPIGDLEIIALHDGVMAFDRPPGFISNVSDDETGAAFATAGMPAGKVTLTFTTFAIKSATGVVLIDTGLGDSGPPGTGTMVANLAAAGITPADVSTVIISHFHFDHISGLRLKNGTAVYPNAEIVVPEVEWNFWMDESLPGKAPDGLKDTIANSHRVFDPIAKDVRRFAFGSEVLPGITAIDARGHTPGMAALRIASGNEAMMFVADITNNPLIFARHPDWKLMFDMDADQAVTTRKRLLDQAAAEKLRVSFYHAPFPSTGYIVKNGAGYEFLPALWTA